MTTRGASPTTGRAFQFSLAGRVGLPPPSESWPSTASRGAIEMSTATTDATVEATEAPTEASERTPETTATHAPTEGEVTEATLVEIPLEQLRINPLNLRRRV